MANFDGKSLYIRNNFGPSIEPCRTQYNTELELYSMLLTTTCRVLLRYENNRLINP